MSCLLRSHLKVLDPKCLTACLATFACYAAFSASFSLHAFILHLHHKKLFLGYHVVLGDKIDFNTNLFHYPFDKVSILSLQWTVAVKNALVQHTLVWLSPFSSNLEKYQTSFHPVLSLWATALALTTRNQPPKKTSATNNLLSRSMRWWP